MAEITANGYQSLRGFIQSTWKYIELRDGSGTPIIRLSPSDQRVTWTHQAGNQTLELTIVVKGSDADLASALPKTFAQSAIFDVASGGSPYSVETYTAFTMETSMDELTVKHQIQVPQVV
ncbi:hypothetical protein [Brevibacillus fortis]|uniref:hypothetical protein n=1 Tax=Brevibacillus fortis TaxID=2126352 RepID=UPI0038FC5890